MIAVAELDSIAAARLEDARVLLAAGRFDGATYLCGYAVEVALKARICRVRHWSELPSTGSEFQAYPVWKAEPRYNVVGTAQQPDAFIITSKRFPAPTAA
jgi:hypothetical protein